MKNNTIIVVLLSISFSGLAQNIGINTTGAVPNGSAMLDVVATDKGVLIPRINITDLNTAAPVSSPASSLLVYNTNTTTGVGYYYWDGTKWVKLTDTNSNSDDDWYKVGGTSSPNNINDDIFTNGKVGIGINTPSANLEVNPGSLNGTVTPLRTVIKAMVTPGSSNGYNLFYGSGGTTLNTGTVYGVHIDLSNGGTTYGMYSQGETYNFFSGRVGVGTTTPEGSIHVITTDQANFLSDGIGFLKGTGGNDYQLQINSVGGVPHIDLANSANEDFDIRLAVYNDNKLAIEGGNVGIGTQTASEKLQIEQGNLLMNGNAAQIFLKANLGSTDPGDIVFLNGDASPKARIWSDPANNQGLNINGDGSGSSDIYIQANGNVGIGTFTPSERLHVIGNILASGTITSSDIRYKENIREIESTENLLQLKPVSYYFKNEYIENGQFDERLHFGLIAQDVEKIYPNLVYENNDGFKAINYTELIAILIKSNQELRERIARLEQKQ